MTGGAGLVRRRAAGLLRRRETRVARRHEKGLLRRREARVLRALVDAVAAPEPPLPPVERTDAVAAFAAWLEPAPRLNRALLRAALRGLLIARFAARDRTARLAFLGRLERFGLSRPLAEALRAAAAVAYYGDAGVLRVLGHDPVQRVRAARAARMPAGVAS